MKNDIRYIKNEERIKSAFKSMVEEMNFEDITVKELTKRANINRKTFYLHYSSIDDLLKCIQMELTNEYLERVKDLDIFEDYYELTKVFYTFHEEKGLFCEKLTCDPTYDNVRNQLINGVESQHTKSDVVKNMNKDKSNIIYNFINETTISIYRSWIRSGKSISVDEMIELNYKLVIEGLNGIIKGTK